MAKKIMIQGTMSNSGKSFLAAGLCRIFVQDGCRCAPFKSQNMALNSFITDEGLEMGRAQVMQAEAAKTRPRVEMNPILLKPTNDTGSQVIVNGKVLGTMQARDYFAYKQELVPEIKKAFRALEQEYDIIVIEGAGSPAEINLKQNDIVNMGMAEMVNAPVLLTGDIDRGGVFAQLYGTVELLEAQERERIKGLIINKFRGDKTILDPGIQMLEEKCRIPVAGVIPYMPVELEDEDSLTGRFERGQKKEAVDIAVVRLPRISNFTDFNIFETIPGVSLRYVKYPGEMGTPDMVILPGSKNTMGDLKWLRGSGMEAMILKLADRGCVVFGICGGYQMLGETLEDPEQVEEGGSLAGLGLLPMRTIFQEAKRRTRVTGTIRSLQGKLASLKGVSVEGYEIHMGTSALQDESAGLLVLTEKQADHTSTRRITDGMNIENIYGTYVHGIFDKKEMAEGVVKALGRAKGLDMEAVHGMDYQDFKETQYDLLAATLREYLDMEYIYRMMEEGEE